MAFRYLVTLIMSGLAIEGKPQRTRAALASRKWNGTLACKRPKCRRESQEGMEWMVKPRTSR